MSEPSRQNSRHRIAGGALAAIAIAGAGFALGRATYPVEPAPADPEQKPPVVQLPKAPPPTLPAISPVLGRADLLAAASAAADASAAGRPVPEDVAQLAGRRFELRLPFGCGGAPADSTGALQWSYDADKQALRLRAAPVAWNPEEWGSAPAPEGEVAVEAIEGFWITRPWTSSETCPPGALEAPQIAPEQTIGLAEFFTEASSRVGRRDGKAFEEVEKLAPDAVDASQGFRWRLSGQVAPAPDGRLVLCRSPGAGTRPVCLVSVKLDQVAFETAGAQTIARWDVAGQGSGRSPRAKGDPNQ